MLSGKITNMKNIRQLDKKLASHFDKYPQAITLLGPRQVGKTTILKKIFPEATYLLLDDAAVRDVLETYSISSYKQILGDSRQVILDELHLLSNPGRAVKILYDQIENIQIIVTGSSSLHIKNKTSESMAGRSIDYKMFPLTYSEYLVQSDIEKKLDNRILDKVVSQNSEIRAKLFNQNAVLEYILKFGLYPDTLNLPEDKQYLENLIDKVIFKDIIELNLIENRAKAMELLKSLAYQIGNLISYTELGSKLGLSTKTVQRYIEIFEQSFIIYRLYPYSKDKREEIGKAPKIYFNDVGLRNALIRNYDPMNIRSDSGAIFENFIITEIKKIVEYTNSDYSLNYWRLKSGAEVDLVLSNSRELIGSEIKMSKGKVSSAFKDRYPEAKTHVITAENFY